MNLTPQFSLWELAAGAAVGAGIVAGTGWSAAWVTVLAALAAMLLGLLARQWIATAAVALALWVAVPIWRPILPGDTTGVPTVGDLIGTTTTTPPATPTGPVEPVSPAGAEAETTGGEAAG